MSPDAWILLRPWWLLALVPAAVLVWRLARHPAAGAAAWSRLIDAHLLPHVLTDVPAPRRRLGPALLAAGLTAAVVALAGPAFGPGGGAPARPDLTRVLVVDLSPAMAAGGGAPSPMEQVRLKLLELLRLLPAGQTALLVYADEPYLVVPPSTDVETLARFVPELVPDAVPVAGNRPDRALAMAAEVLARSPSREREILWITAGAAPVPPPAAAPAGIRLSILHASQEDDPALAALARGGPYLRLQPDDSDIRRLAARPAAGGGGASEGEGRATDGGCWLLLPLLPLAALAFRRGVLGIAVGPLLLAGFLAPEPAAARESSLRQGLADYRAWKRLQAGDAAAAADGFADRRWRAAASYRAGRFDQAADLLAGERDADSLYNRGNALARQGRLAEALAAYESSLSRREDADARHNRDLVARLLSHDGGDGRGRGGDPPPAADAPPPPSGGGDPARREAGRLAERWLRQVPDEPGSLLRRKLLAEHRRRAAGEEGRP